MKFENIVGGDRKANILEATLGGLKVFEYYIPDFKHVQKPFCSPLRSDNKPSANIFQGTGTAYIYKDFATGKTLNCFDFVGELKSVTDFTEIMDIIERDVMNITKPVKTLRLENASATPLDKAIVTVLEKDNGNYWKQYIDDDFRTNQYLEKYEVFALDSFQTNGGKTIKSKNHNPIYGFKISDGCYKIYQPLIDSKYKHQWIGRKPADYSNIFGIDQLPARCDTILITEGYKDCFVSNANLNQYDIYAVGLDNVSTKISASTIEMLKGKCKSLLLCMDIDEPGLKGAENKSKEHGLRILTLPDLLKQHKGKDIADWFKFKLDTKLLLEAIKAISTQPEPVPDPPRTTQSTLQKLLTIEAQLTETASKEIVKAPSVVEYAGFPIFKQGTLNLIQGKFGSHKSRLAQGFCSLLLSTENNPTFVGFKRCINDFVVCYIDTERNAKEEFPLAIKSIVKEAGIALKDNKTFRFTSIKTIARNKRLGAVKQFLESICKNREQHVFAILDVGTDCVVNFNDPEESMLLIDFIGNLSEEFNTTFLLVVHENPNSKKARGHLGSEGVNKASTVISISVVSEKLIKLEYIKQRATKHFEPLFLTYDETANRLIKASQDLVNAADDAAKPKAPIEEVIIELGKIMTEPTEFLQKELLHTLTQTFDCSDNTIKQRLDSLVENKDEIENVRGEPCYLIKNVCNGKQSTYGLARVDQVEEEKPRLTLGDILPI